MKLVNILFFIILIPVLILAKEEGQEVIKKQVPITREDNLIVTLSFGNGYINIGKINSNTLFDGEFTYQKYRPDIQYEIVGKEGRLDVHFSGNLKKDTEDNSHSISSFKNIYDNELRLNLSDKIPINMDLELGVIKGTLNLSGLKISKLNTEIGVSQANIVFEDPSPVSMESCKIQGGVGRLHIEKLGNANFKNFKFEGGIGSYELDLSGSLKENSTVNIEMGMGKVTLFLPRYVGTRIKVEKSFLSSFSIDDCYKKGNYYYNDNWEKTSRSMDVNINTGVGKVEIVWVDKK